MRRSTLLVISVVVTGAILFSPKRTAAGEADTPSIKDNSSMRKESIPWSQKMQGLYRTLADLLTDVSSDRRFNDPANRVRIQGEADKLSSLVHDLNKKGMVSLDVDPTVRFIAGLLGAETKRAAAELSRGNRIYARSILRSVPTYCIACHTRNATGPEFAELPFEPSSKSLTVFERGEFYAATRQFDRAQAEFKTVIEDPKTAATNVLDWKKAVQQSLAIAIRVKENPAQAQQIVETVLKMPHAPLSMMEDAKTWQTSITEWRNEGAHHTLTEEGLYSEVIRLMAKAHETQKYPMDRTADILYLRTSAAIHDLLQLAPNGMHSDEALLLAGITYEVLSPLDREELHEIFYGACVRKSPHTPIAEVCFRRLEADIILDYTGSSGTDMPADISERLRDLHALAEPLSGTVNQAN
jgi:hypothetical protein